MEYKASCEKIGSKTSIVSINFGEKEFNINDQVIVQIGKSKFCCGKITDISQDYCFIQDYEKVPVKILYKQIVQIAHVPF